MRRKGAIVIMTVLLALPLLAKSEFKLFVNGGAGAAIIHARGNFAESSPQFEFSVLPHYLYGAGITLSNIGLGFTTLKFDTPFTLEKTRTLYSLYLGGAVLSYYQNDIEKVLDFSFINREATIFRKGRFSVEFLSSFGLRYYKFAKNESGVYQLHFGIILQPSFSIPCRQELCVRIFSFLSFCICHTVKPLSLFLPQFSFSWQITK